MNFLISLITLYFQWEGSQVQHSKWQTVALAHYLDNMCTSLCFTKHCSINSHLNFNTTLSVLLFPYFRWKKTLRPIGANKLFPDHVTSRGGVQTCLLSTCCSIRHTKCWQCCQVRLTETHDDKESYHFSLTILSGKRKRQCPNPKQNGMWWRQRNHPIPISHIPRSTLRSFYLIKQPFDFFHQSPT